MIFHRERFCEFPLGIVNLNFQLELACSHFTDTMLDCKQRVRTVTEVIHPDAVNFHTVIFPSMRKITK